MNRRRFLRAAGLAGIASVAGCSTPFDPVSTPEPAKNGSGATSGNTDDSSGSGGSGESGGSGGGGGSNESGGGGGGSNGDGTQTTTPEAPKTRSGAALTGVYPGKIGLTSKLSTYSEWLSQKPAVAVVFVDALAGTAETKGFVEGALTNIWKAGHVPMISWQPLVKRSNNTSERVEVEIADGKYEKQIATWASALDSWARPNGEKSRGRRFYFRPAHEMNGNWFPWSAVDSSRIPASTNRPGTPEDYVSMWRYLHKAFADTGMDETNVQWVWSPNADEPGNSIRAEEYYPGDGFVDWVGIDGFNFGGSQRYSNWRTPEELFDSILNRTKRLTDKPKALTEFASSSVPDSGNSHQPQKKAQWIEDTFSYVEQNDIKMTCWFNEDKTGGDETDWAVFGGSQGAAKTTIDGERYSTYPAYKRAVTSSQFLGALSDYPPLLTDDEFAGDF